MPEKKAINNKIKLLPLLVFYIVFVMLFAQSSFWGDESRYVMYATNLSQGHYSPHDDVYLWNGPGYPIILLPFTVLKQPWLYAKLLNPVFLFLGVLYVFSLMRLYIKERSALYLSYIFGLYLPFLKHIHRLLTESLSIFLVCGFIFHFCQVHRNDKISWPHLLAASFYLGYLALTKILFGYVILVGLVLYLLLYIWKKKIVYKKTFLVYLFALICCLPYLVYTYSLTGKIYYWGNSGSSSLYWMSTPNPNEYGDWYKKVLENPEYEMHQEFFKKLEELSYMERDEELKKRALYNIINNPSKYVKNWIANIGRLLFNYPYSYTDQKLSTYFYIIPNMFIVVIFVLCVYPAVLGRKRIPHEVYGILLFGIVSFGGSSLLSAYNRQFWPLVPVFFFWIVFVLNRIVNIEVRR